MEYTKGEWKVVHNLHGWHISCGEIGLAINVDSKANAHLIAAAPGMYEALKGILLVAIPHDKTDSMVFEKEYIGKFDVLGNRLEEAVEALAKADKEVKGV